MCVAAPVFADADPSMHEVYEAAESGHLDQAQRMISQVLKDHPTSGKAHYVAAEIYAREGNYSLARDELGQAQHLEPGLPFAKPGSVQELQAELSAHSPGAATQVQHRPNPGVSYAPASSGSFPWGLVLVGLGIIALIVFVTRRLRYAMGYRGIAPDGMRGGYNPGYAPGYGGYGAPPPGGGMGSGIVGGLASGLAVGAGVVAGEELAHHFLDGDREHGGGGFAPPVDTGGGNYNGDMGGNDFGVNDSSSWDSGSSGGDFGGGGGGGDDWS